MGQWLRRILELLRILDRNSGNSEDTPISAEEWKAKLSALQQDEYEYSKRLANLDIAREQLKKRLDDAQARGEKDFQLDRYRHLYKEADANFETLRRQVDGIRTNVSRLADLVRMWEEKLRAGLVIDPEQYHREARELYTAIQTRQEQLREIEVSRSVLAETRDTAFNGGPVSSDEFKVDLGEVTKDKAPEVE
ncbi:MAG: hypothetical protein KBE65_20710 [Phycisphaerae bacterium]|nr:hypothetical protein [Phycisphaerae bacterium]